MPTEPLNKPHADCVASKTRMDARRAPKVVVYYDAKASQSPTENADAARETVRAAPSVWSAVSHAATLRVNGAAAGKSSPNTARKPRNPRASPAGSPPLLGAERPRSAT